MDELIIDEFEIETETDNGFEEDIISNDIEVMNISVDDSMDDLLYDLIYQTEYLETENVPETELINVEPETVKETELINVQPETVPETELINVEPETVPETELINVEPETVPETELINVEPETVPETELINVEPETVPETELINVEPETVPETEMINVEPETVSGNESNIEIIDVVSEYVNNVEVTNDDVEEYVEVDKDLQNQPAFQEKILSDNKEVEEKHPEVESEFSFVELVKDTSKKDENINDGSNNDNTIYDIDDIYNLISFRIPENSRLFTSKHNLDDIYDLLSDNMSPDILSSTYVPTLKDDVEVVEVEDDLKKGETDEVEESETISLSDIYDLIDEQNKILKSNQEVEIAILQNQKTMSDNDNKMNTFLVSGVFALLGAVVISNLFRGIK